MTGGAHRAECCRDPVRIEDHDHRAVAEDGVAGEGLDMPQLGRHRLHHDFLGVEHAVDHDAEGFWLPTCVTTTKPLSVSCVGGVAEPQQLAQIDQRQQLVAQPQDRRVLDALDAVLACPPRTRTSSITATCGMAKRSPADSTISAETMASVSGILMVKTVPCPGTDFTSMVPPIWSILLCTTSMPTPRPEMLVTSSAVDKPAREDEALDLRVGHLFEFGLGREPAGERLGADLAGIRARGRRRRSR